MIDKNLYNGIQIKTDLPYPEININFKDKQLAINLLNVYIDEINEILQYKYEFIITNIKEIKDILLIIYQSELIHFDIIGNLVFKLGLKPTYTYFNKVNNQNYYNTSNVLYTTDINKFIKNNIKKEKLHLENYKYILSLNNDINFNAIISRIIEDEINHIKLFESILNNLI